MPRPGLEVSVGKLPNQNRHKNAQLGQSRAELKSLFHPQVSGKSITSRILPEFYSCSLKAASPYHWNAPTAKPATPLSYFSGLPNKEYILYFLKKTQVPKWGLGI